MSGTVMPLRMPTTCGTITATITAAESCTGPGARYEPDQEAMDNLFMETGLILYGRYARKAKIAGYHLPSKFVISIRYLDV
jgi:hypothetical protein